MVELLNDFPGHVAAYAARGAVSKEEYRSVVMRRVDEVAKRYGHINFLVRLETDMGNYSIGAFLEYLKVSFEHFLKWERMAIVTDEKWVRTAYKILSSLVHGEIRTYPLTGFLEAKAWVSGPMKTGD
ncbi:STAS/SEC14 domain-containing protein [Chitinophaga sp. NPDC101104]|uniref:STAS/SEC14 domain-containing protein n=1 Tax=Chitinophaga sp. NPDC101104 TaxID=3390561 RepID=UPI003D08BFA0